MSYNGSGTFVINSTGQPVVTGTVISSSTFNSLTADLGTGLTTAITKDGQTTTTAKIPFAQGISAAVASNFAAGTVGAPSIYLSSDTTTGLYRIGANNDGFAISGVKLLDLGSALVGVTGALTVSTTLNVTGVATLGNGAILGTPASGTVTNLTGTASININGTVGATTPTTGAFTSGTFSTTLGVTGATTFNGTSNTFTSTNGIYVVPGTGTLSASIRYSNTGGNLYIGLDSSGGGDFGPSVGAYATIISRPASTAFAISRGATLDFYVGTTGAIIVGGGSTAVTNLDQNTKFHVVSSVNSFNSGFQSTGSTPSGTYMYYNTAVNSSSSPFLRCDDSGGSRAFIYSNGGLANYSGNNVNLSDIATKDVFEDYTPTMLDELESKFCALRRGRFKYNDQTHDDWNYGKSAQSVAEHLPELADVWNPDKPEEEQLLCEYSHDITQIGEALLVRALKRIEQLAAKVAALEAK